MNFLKELISGRSGKTCATKVLTIYWIIFVSIIIGFLAYQTKTWPQVPEMVYISILGALANKTYGDIKLKQLDSQPK